MNMNHNNCTLIYNNCASIHLSIRQYCVEAEWSLEILEQGRQGSEKVKFQPPHQKEATLCARNVGDRNARSQVALALHLFRSTTFRRLIQTSSILISERITRSCVRLPATAISSLCTRQTTLANNPTITHSRSHNFDLTTQSPPFSTPYTDLRYWNYL